MMELNGIKGLGPKTIDSLNKVGFYDTNDLVNYYPYRYQVIKRSEELKQDSDIVIDGVVETKAYVIHLKKGMDKMQFKVNNGTNLFNVGIFNRGFLKNKIVPGISVILIGKYDLKHNTIIASEIRFGLLPSVPLIEPKYHASNGITSNLFSKYINSSLSLNEDYIDYIPEMFKEKYHFLNKNLSLKIIHNPNSIDDLKKSRRRLKYEELFLFMLKINEIRKNRFNSNGIMRKVDFKLVLDMFDSLPFKLTDDQVLAIKDIYNDLTSKKQMNRLVQGDVGSGKTIVAFIAMYINYLGGYQSAFMAPTEILASQHFINLKSLFSDLNICLLTGKMKVSEKRKIYKDLKDGVIDILVGTHALIQDDVIYNNLGLVITDEQHRFGVNQRCSLKNKGMTPDVLSMSATPIPRTYALTLYGDMDISSIKTMPSGRKKVITSIKKESEIKDVLSGMYDELKNNHQIYVIAPLIEESDCGDFETVSSLEEKMNKAFGKLYKIGVLHGKMQSDEKNTIMNSFKENEIQILISTTVIEVGVDVGNATMIVIFNSDRFGLSQLHQLRGRVGRNEFNSYCLLISNKDTERLEVLVNNHDGFKVSEKDFELRGSGDILGIRQSGDMSFKLASVTNDFDMIVSIKKDIEFLENSGLYDTYLHDINISKIMEQISFD